MVSTVPFTSFGVGRGPLPVLTTGMRCPYVAKFRPELATRDLKQYRKSNSAILMTSLKLDIGEVESVVAVPVITKDIPIDDTTGSHPSACVECVPVNGAKGCEGRTLL